MSKSICVLVPGKVYENCNITKGKQWKEQQERLISNKGDSESSQKMFLTKKNEILQLYL